jgi:hypothetical protein
VRSQRSIRREDDANRPARAEPPDARLHGLLTVYQVERQDQQTSGNQSRALLGTGLAYAAGVAALLSRADPGSTGPILLVAAPLPLVALISFLVLGIGNVQQRAEYLVALEQELEPYLSADARAPDEQRFRLTVPNGFRRSELVFSPRPAQSDGYLVGGASPLMRSVASYAFGALTHGIMFLVEIGLIAYVLRLVDHGWRTVGIVFYGACLAVQLFGIFVALRPGRWEELRPSAPGASDDGATCAPRSRPTGRPRRGDR